MLDDNGLFMKQKLIEFFMQTSSGTLGTIVGILLTIGTTYYQQEHEQRQMERTATLMVIHNLDRFCSRLELNVRELERADSLNLAIWNSPNISKIPNDTLEMFINNFMSFQMWPVDNTAENIFSTNIDTWKNIGSSEFVELAGKCFSAKNLIVKLRDEMNKDQLQLYDTLMATIFNNSHPPKSPSEAVLRIFESSALCCFIRKQHEYYVRGMKGGLMVLKEQNARNKKLMNVTGEELKRFGDNEIRDYTFSKEKEPTPKK